MKFKSTRGGVKGASFADVILSGYAPDGGLYVPEALPHIGEEQLRKWSKLDFTSLAQAIFALFVGDELEPDELERLTKSFYKNFESPEVVPVTPVGNLHVSELFHGPTYCFKDLGLQPTVGFLAHFAQRRGERRTMLVSTTGDTGPAAIRAVNDAAVPGLEIVVFYPDGQISDLQRKQMTTCCSEACRVVAFDGGGDDMDVPLKNLASDQSFSKKYGLVGINSYNLGRPVAQLVHCFWSYFQVIKQRKLEVGAVIDMVIPCGALGNLAACFMSRQMGLPLRRLVAGTNTNDITHRTIATGRFHKGEMGRTMAEAINIQVPYNMERIFYYLTGEDSALVGSWMAQMDKTGQLTLPPQWHAKMKEVFSSARIDDATMCKAAQRSLDEYGYLADPHTATALAAAWEVCEGVSSSSGTSSGSSHVPVVVLATASPCKFEAVMVEAVGASQWKKYEDSKAFPATARAVMGASETTPARFVARGDIAATQELWESQVRAMLTGGNGADAPKARL